MRLLENCIDNSASQEVKGQIETLREAFSVDLSRPFVLNPSFPFYPGAQAHMVEAQMTSAYVQADAVQASTLAPNSQVNFSSYPISPPYSTDDETRDESPGIQQPIVMVSSSEGTSPAAQAHALTPDEVQWNPSQLFK